MSYDLRRQGGFAPAARAAASSAVAAVSVLLLVAGALAALTLAGCGKEGPPTPPLRAVPAPTKDLVVRQRGTHVLLSFTYPQTTPGGRALNGVTKVEIYEAVVPPPPPPKEPKGGKKGAAAAAGAKGAATTAAPKGAAATPAAGAGTGAAPGAAAGAEAGSAAGTAPATTGAAGTTGTTGASGTSGATGATGAAGTTGATGASGTSGAAGATGAAGTAGAPGTAATAGAGGTGKTAAGAPGTPAAGSLIEEPETLDPKAFEHLAKVRVTLSGKDIGTATLGNQLIVDLPLPEPLPTTTTNGTAREYAVRTYGPQGDRSALSNQIRLLPKVPPPPPATVKVAPQADGIEVEWQPVTNAGGYAIYRRAATERFSSKPLAVVRPPRTRYLDQSARFAQSYIYSVTAMDAKESLIESAIQSEQEIHYIDRYPPPVPEELVVVTEAGKARLVWRPSEASDLAGYIVYRKGPTGDFVRLTAKPILATSYVDDTVASGQAYDYRVTAIDLSGNESGPGEVHAVIP